MREIVNRQEEFAEKQETLLKERIVEEKSIRMQEEIKLAQEVTDDNNLIYTQSKKVIELMNADVEPLNNEELKEHISKLRRVIKVQSNLLIKKEGRIESVLRRLGKLNLHIHKTIEMFREER